MMMDLAISLFGQYTSVLDQISEAKGAKPSDEEMKIYEKLEAELDEAFKGKKK
jgi:hypothetical protein